MILNMELVLVILKLCPAGCEDLQANHDTFHTCKMLEFKTLLKGSSAFSMVCLLHHLYRDAKLSRSRADTDCIINISGCM